jgi:uncharacterized protein YcbX
MGEIPQVAKLLIYPIKSLDGVAVETATVLKSGALQGDREFALVDAAGQFVNGKRQQRIHAIRTEFDLAARIVSLAVGDRSAQHFHLDDQRQAIAHWMSDYFGFPVQLRQNQEMGFPDDTRSPGPTLVSAATLTEIATWYPEITVDEVRRRFRSNIEISQVPAFWEDQLFAATETPVQFQLGEVSFIGINPCQRCVVVTRNPWTGEADPSFQKTFVAHRQETFPNWAPRSRFNHFFRLAVNTRVADSQGGQRLHVGDRMIVSSNSTCSI